MVEDGPPHYLHGVVHWRLSDLADWIDDEFDVFMVETTVGRNLSAMGYWKLAARPRHHGQDAEAKKAFNKSPRQRSGKPRPPLGKHGHRDLILGRSPDRPEEQDPPALGQCGGHYLGARHYSLASKNLAKH